jgi:hypothetical protein
MKNFAIMTTIHLVKNPNTKTTFIEEERETEQITEQTYRNIVSSSKYFRQLGGSETHTRAYTCRGYNTIKLTSVSPNRQNKKIYEFKFIEL